MVAGDLARVVRNRVAADFSASVVAHDIDHLDRVARLASQIAVDEGGDPEIAAVVAYVHDYHRLLERGQEDAIAPEAAWIHIERVLAECDVPRAFWKEIEQAVVFTGVYGFGGDTLENGTKLASIVHDADKLDAIGAIGIARAFMYGGSIAEPLWNPSAVRLEVYRPGKTTSVIAHFYEKLLRLRDEMLTETGRRLAEERTVLLLRYLCRFHEEWGDAGTAPVRTLMRSHTS
jgi:uncharacterized protein